jgi:threonine synthase
VVQAFEEALTLNLIPRMPKFTTVQTRGAFPLQRAYDAVVDRIITSWRATEGDDVVFPSEPVSRAARILDVVPRATLDTWVAFAARHRSVFMWPWELAPHSVAEGILDDETYDWLAVVRGMLLTGGVPLVVEEHALRHAHDLAQQCARVPADHTGAAGVAGLVRLVHEGAVSPRDRTAVLLTGEERG